MSYLAELSALSIRAQYADLMSPLAVQISSRLSPLIQTCDFITLGSELACCTQQILFRNDLASSHTCRIGLATMQVPLIKHEGKKRLQYALIVYEIH